MPHVRRLSWIHTGGICLMVGLPAATLIKRSGKKMPPKGIDF